MGKSKRHERKAKVSGISSADALKRFVRFLGEVYDFRQVEDKGPYVVLHGRILLPDENNIDVIVYTTDRMFLPASPYVHSSTFDQIATRVIGIAQSSINKLAEARPLTFQRATSILEFASTLKLDNEFQKMVMVILADTSNEIVLTEQMKALKIGGPPLAEGIPDKIKRLESKGKVVYKKREIISTRELRNGIVHRGDIPDRTQTTRALEIAKNVLESA